MSLLITLQTRALCNASDMILALFQTAVNLVFHSPLRPRSNHHSGDDNPLFHSRARGRRFPTPLQPPVTWKRCFHTSPQVVAQRARTGNKSNMLKSDRYSAPVKLLSFSHFNISIKRDGFCFELQSTDINRIYFHHKSSLLCFRHEV